MDTRLVLIEGIPGSGKSTTASVLARSMEKIGINCRCHLEWSKDNPIFIGRPGDLAQIISTADARRADILGQWRAFARTALHQNRVHIMESRFWQADAMYLFLSGRDEALVAAHNKQVARTIAGLNPVLIFLAPKDIARHLALVSDLKNKKWRQRGRPGTWEDWGNSIYKQQKWFTDRPAAGSDAFVRFFSQWTNLANTLFRDLPFRKIKLAFSIPVWDGVLDEIHRFLNIPRTSHHGPVKAPPDN